MNATGELLILTILLPAVTGSICLLISDKWRGVKEGIALLTTGAGLLLAVYLFWQEELRFFTPWLPHGIDLDLRLYPFSWFILLAASGFSFLISLYSISFMRGKPGRRPYYAYLLLTASFTYGAVLANNFVILLIFWGALILTLYGMIALGGGKAYLTATKSFIIVGLSDLFLILGIMITASLSGTLTMDRLLLPLTGIANLAFVLMIIGALAKAGAMPFHSWIPDAAVDAPLPVVAFLPAALEKLLGIYLLARISLDFFVMSPTMGFLLLTIGAVTIVLAVAMALIQKDYKKLLSFHAISQVGYMVLGIGTGVPIGIAGGIFHMLNHSMYKCCLFLSGGSVERMARTTDLAKLGGLSRQMPVTFTCFAIAALSISGVPPFNGFFSKEMIFEAASGLDTPVFLFAAQLGAILTFASFLKLGHSVYLGKKGEELSGVKESPVGMLVPMIVLAAGCLLFGLFNRIPLAYLIEPVLPMSHGHYGGPIHWSHPLTMISIACLLLALGNHLYGYTRTGSALKAVDHIRRAPLLTGLYDRAEDGRFDPYRLGIGLNRLVSAVLYSIDRMNNWIYDRLTLWIVNLLSVEIRKAHTGLFGSYLSWCLFGGALILAVLLWGG